METLNFIKRILTSPQRSRQKTRVINHILETPQMNKEVVNIHRMDCNNAGDWYGAPHHYFEKLQNTALDIFDYKNPDKNVTENWVEKISENKLIIGGGGLLNRGGFKLQMKLFEDLTQMGKKIILWGIGHNEKNPKYFGKVKQYNIDISKFALTGTRDYSMPGNWVPCVSCMHPIFDENYQEDQETGIVFHKDTLKNPKILNKFKRYPSTSNTTDLESLIEFIGRSKNIITDSYHAMYWSILLKKKVVVVPNSSKFFDFKYPPVISSFENCLEDLPKAIRYSGVLEECREINSKFADEVFNLIEK